MKYPPARQFCFLATLLFAIVLRAAEDPAEILLWPGGAPGSGGQTAPERVERWANGEHKVSRIHHPSLTPYLPPAGQSTGAAVIVIPGGAHQFLAIDHEGYNVARWLSEHGIAAFVLKYRLARDTNSTYQVEVHALADTQRAIRLVRNRAEEWHINPDAVGVLGFSAGGELAALAGMRPAPGQEGASDPVERQGCRPDFQALIYPGGSRRITVTKSSPPAFLACGYKDRPDISEGLAAVYLKFKQAAVPAELHIYSAAGHGFGLRPSNRGAAANWPMQLKDWLADAGFLRMP